nr:MAG TPA: MerF protein, mercury transporter, lipid [Caudoviricetes sp.]
MAEALRFLGIFFIAIAAGKLGLALYCYWRDSRGRKED